MGILQKLKSALGMDSGGRSRRRTQPDVTVEHEPSAESERAVKKEIDEEPAVSDDEEPTVPEDQEPAVSDDEEPTVPEDQEPAVSDEPEPDAPGAEAAAPEDGPTEAEDAGAADSSPSVEEITGIGATYAERLEAAGIETVADLADSDRSTVVEAAQATESRVEDWLEQARDW
jgi:predicted flap endonuclease-1-like 5' DNA nuclease